MSDRPSIADDDAFYASLKPSPLAPRPARHARSRLDEATRKARAAEQSRRAAVAQGRADSAMRRLHPDDYQRLFAAAKREVVAERGPLPGDPS